MKLTDSLEIRQSSGSLTAGETTSGVKTHTGTVAVVHINIETMTTGGSDEVDFYIQTTYDHESMNDSDMTWFDVENIHFDVADNGSTPQRLCIIGVPTDTASVAPVGTDGTIGDDSKNDLPIGTKVRVKTKITNSPTYAYSANLMLRS